MHLSKDGIYRYSWWRELPGRSEGAAAFISHNPARKDGSEQTVQNCVALAAMWGYGLVRVVNLYACITGADSSLLRIADDPIGPANDRWIAKALANADLVVCSWGDKAEFRRAKEVLLTIKEPHCIGLPERELTGKAGNLTEARSPRHPARLRALGGDFDRLVPIRFSHQDWLG